jgi:hypothetical protein
MPEDKQEPKLNPLEQAMLAAKKFTTEKVDNNYTVKMNAESCERNDIPRSGLDKAMCDVDKKEAQKRGL